MTLQEILGRTNCLTSFDTTRTVQKTTLPKLFFVEGTCLLRRCLTNDWGYTYRHTDFFEGVKKYSIEMGSVAMMYITKFH